MKSSTHGLVLAADAAVDLQVHTHYSDGAWTPDALLDYLGREQFGLVAITDHDRADTAPALQQLAAEKGIPVLVAVEMTTTWRGEMTDVLCYGFDPQNNELNALAQDIARRQRENTQMILDKLAQQGFTFPLDEVTALLDTPSAQQPHSLVALVKAHNPEAGDKSPGKRVMEAGFSFITTEIGAVVDAAHRSGAVCLIAHPGRDDGFPKFDTAMLDDLRCDVPVDGLEAYYPMHTPEQIALYLDYARQHGLLVSSGSDSHTPDKPPVKYRAELSRELLERVGIRVE